MGVDPSDCLVFEDGKPGIEAAVAAGMGWVFVPSRFG
jgi:HAD superfamily hydrolase (TIGR01509 family)